MAASPAAAGDGLAVLRARMMDDPEFLRVSDLVFCRKLAEQAFFWLVGAWLVLGTGSVPLWILGTVLIGTVYARNLEFVHECIHFTALRNRRLSRFFGTLLALPLVTSFEEWRVSHLRHHADVRDEGFEYRPDAIGSWRTLIGHWLLAEHFRSAFGKMWCAVADRSPPSGKAEARIRRDFRLMAAAVAGGVVLDLALGRPLVTFLWFLPLIPAAVANFHIQLPEHLYCVTESGSALLNSRTVAAGRFARWLVNGNNFHSSHHWLASAPIRRLPEIDAGIRPHVVHVERSYPAFYLRYYRELLGRFSELRL